MNARAFATVLNVLSVARGCTRAEAGTVYVREAEGLRFLVTQNDKLARLFGRAGSADLLTEGLLRWSERSIATYAALTRTPLNIPDAYAIPNDRPYRFNPRVDSATGFQTVSMLVVPLQYPVDGLLQLINARDESGITVPFSRAAEHALDQVLSRESELSPWISGQR